MRKINQISSSGFLTEKEAVKEKKEQLARLICGESDEKSLSAEITNRRLKWMRTNLSSLQKKYSKLSPEEQAYVIIYFEHMNINPDFSKMTRISDRKIRIDSYNFCPYLEACKSHKLDPRVICEKINRESFEEAVKLVHPKLVFYRNYKNVRPYTNYCEEYIELKEG